MKMRLKQVVIFAFALVGAVVLYALVPSDERRIHTLLARVVREINEQPRGGTLSDIATANRVADFFGPEFEIIINASGAPEVSISDRSELVQAILNARRWRHGIKVALLDPQTVKVAPPEAVVDATGKAQVSGESEVFVSELRFTFLKIDGRWRIRKIESIRTFE